MRKFLNTIEASSYLADKHNVVRTPATLAQSRHRGVGPAFRRIGRDVVYEPPALDAWVAKLISPPLTTTCTRRRNNRPLSGAYCGRVAA